MSERFRDIYYSTDAAREVGRVFLNPADVAARLRRSRTVFCVGELGFGTGLNFLSTAALVEANPSARLHYVSFEAEPLTPADLRLAWPSDSPVARELRQAYPPLVTGWHRRRLARGRITLSLYFGDIADGLPEFARTHTAGVDAWFLDGFAPAKNPDMWTPALWPHLARASRLGTTVTTFTAAGHVRRGLSDQGFSMRRVDQRPWKRESLAGEFQAESPTAVALTPRRVEVVGAGLAGASVARLLTEAGCTVHVTDPFGIAAGASRIPCALVHGRLLADGSLRADWRMLAFRYSSHFLRSSAGFDATGILQGHGANTSRDRLVALHDQYANTGDWLGYLNAADASQRAAWNVPDALWFPDAGTLDIAAATHALLEGLDVRRVPADDVDARVLACGVRVQQFASARFLEVTPVHGQIDVFASATAPQIPVVGDGYACRAPGCGSNPGLAVGATYEYQPWQNGEARRRNAARVGLDPATPGNSVRATRCVTSDRECFAGRIGDHDGIPTWVTTGHGSMGTVSAPFAAAIVASDMMGWVPPLSPRLTQVSDPARLPPRQARRGYRMNARSLD